MTTKVIMKKESNIKFISKVSDDSYVVELLDKPGYGNIINLKNMTRSNEPLRLLAFPKWVPIHDLPADFQPPNVSIEDFSIGTK
jgi:hypothetical protein